MADEKLSISSFKELALILGLGGGMAGSTYFNGQTIREQNENYREQNENYREQSEIYWKTTKDFITSNRELAEQVRDSLAVQDILKRQTGMESDLTVLKGRADGFKKDIEFLGAVCERKDKQ